MTKTDKQKREDMARRFSKACISGGRRLSTIFSNDVRRPVPTPELLNRYNNEQNIYNSVPIIYGAKDELKHKFGSNDDILENSSERSKDNINQKN